jgi:hypothetical protein
MFYCDDCATKRTWPESYCKSFGMCEVCRKPRTCNDTPSRNLPDPTPPKVEKVRLADTNLQTMETVYQDGVKVIDVSFSEIRKQSVAQRTLPAEHFALTLDHNVDNAKLSDAAFRELVRNTLPIVIFPSSDVKHMDAIIGADVRNRKTNAKGKVHAYDKDGSIIVELSELCGLEKWLGFGFQRWFNSDTEFMA